MTKRSNKHGIFYTLGKLLGRPLSWLLRKEQCVVNALVNKGFSASLAKRLLTAINLLIFVSILAIIIPKGLIAFVLVFIFIAYAGTDFEMPPPPPKEEWRMGNSGWGLYRGDECIIWNDDPNDPNE